MKRRPASRRYYASMAVVEATLAIIFVAVGANLFVTVFIAAAAGIFGLQAIWGPNLLAAGKARGRDEQWAQPQLRREHPNGAPYSGA